MKTFSGCHYILIGVTAMALAGCSAPEPKADGATATAAAAAPKVAAVKCKGTQEASLGSLIRKDCSAPSEATLVNKEDFINAQHTPGAIPGR